MLYGVSVVQYRHYYTCTYASQGVQTDFDAFKQTIERIFGSYACSYVASLRVEEFHY
jgi:hypothetical protein